MDDGVLATLLANETIAFCASPEATYVARVPLAGIEVESALNFGGVAIRPLTPEELGYMSQQRNTLSFPTRTVARSLPGFVHDALNVSERIALEVRERIDKTTLGSPAIRCQKFLLALELRGVEFSGAGFGAMLMEPLWVQSMGQSIYPLQMPRHRPPELVTLSYGDLEKIASIADRIPTGAVSSPANPMNLALSRFGLGMSRLDPGEALVDFTVCLEALLLGGGDTSELRRRFALNGAVYLGETREQRARIYADLLEIYGARNVMVHGASPSEKRVKTALNNAQALRDRACEICRESLRRALETGWPEDRDFVAALLDDRHESGAADADTLARDAG